MKVLLVSPRTPDTFWSFKHTLPFVAKRAAFPPLGLLTVAAMLPADWQLKVVDLNVEKLREADLGWADCVMVSAMIIHQDSVREIARRCAHAGRTLVAGGPLFTTGHEAFSEIPHFVLGEAEEIIGELVADLTAGTLKPVYRAPSFPSLEHTPAPRYDLINLRHYITMAVQFSRGCPFDCEFCDIIVINGRKPRTKSPAQVLGELEQLRRLGWTDSVFVVDDNFIGNKPRTRTLLAAMIDWRARTRSPMSFFTEASINLADDAELCAQMVAAGFRKVFVGIETPSAEALQECRKLQNMDRNLVDAVKVLQQAGLEVLGGFIVGFDSDTPEVFRDQFEFIQRSGVVTAMVGLLTALPQTRLYQRLQREGRLLAESTGNNTKAVLNFRPRLNRDFLESGYRALMHRLYEPRHYYRRVRIFLRNHRRVAGQRLRLTWGDSFALLRSFWLLGVWHRGRWAYWRFFLGTLVRSPGQLREATELAIMGHHFRRIAAAL